VGTPVSGLHSSKDRVRDGVRLALGPYEVVHGLLPITAASLRPKLYTGSLRIPYVATCVRRVEPGSTQVSGPIRCGTQPGAGKLIPVSVKGHPASSG
jgi:hypothetical protein